MLIVVLTGGVYKVIVKTGAKKNGGTDAKVIINTINMKKKCLEEVPEDLS